MAGLVIDTANFQHPNTTPRTLRVASELLAAGAELPMIARRIYRTKPNAQLRLFGRVLARLETSADGRLVWSVHGGRRPRRGRRPSPQMSEGLIDLLAQSESAEVAILFKDHGDRTRISVRTRDGGVDATALTGAFGGGGHARAAGATHRAAAGRGPGCRARPGGAARCADLPARLMRPARGRSTRASTASSSSAKPAGPTSHDVVALVRRLTGVRRVGHGGTLDPFAMGVLPVFLGSATRMVEYHLADEKAYRATVVFGARSTTDDIDGELTPGAWPRPGSRGRRGRPRRRSAAPSSRCRRTTRPCTWRAGAPTSWPAEGRSPS